MCCEHLLSLLPACHPLPLCIKLTPPALAAALQDVGDERSRTEAEFFYYVSQVRRSR